MKTKWLKPIQYLLAFAWLAVFVYFGINMFMNGSAWEQRLLIDQNINPNVRFSGGKTIDVIENEGYLVCIHEPVYEGVFTLAKEPFVQVDWLAHRKLPDTLEDTLDITGDGQPDIRIVLDTVNQSIEYEALHKDIVGLVDRGSMVDIKTRISDNGEDGLFIYGNKSWGDTLYREGISIRVAFDNPISE